MSLFKTEYRGSSEPLQRSLKDLSIKMNYSCSPFARIQRQDPSETKFVQTLECILSWYRFEFFWFIIIMRIKSNHFKKQFDLNKAELIGEGNFAQVFRIFDNDLHDSIAIRKVKKSQADMEDINKQKHINEELRKVDNENILKIYDIIDQAEAVWYITEYCSGGSLWDALNMCKDNKMGEKEALQCVLQISKGVQELHNHRITHRDLKPENILLKSKYLVGKPLPLIKLADFGLSTQKIIMETIAGTKEYIAPEQAKFHNYTNAVDVWSLGIIFDQILHGTPFYSGEDNKQVFNKILKMPFRIRDESIRGSIKELLLSLLKKKPYERPIIAVIKSTVEKILEEIENEQNQKNNESQIQRSKKSKSSNQSKGGDFSKNSSEAKLNSANSSSKDNILTASSRKVYQSGSTDRNEEEKLQKTWRSNLPQDSTPNSRHKPNLIKEQLNAFAKNQSTTPRGEQKPPQKVDRAVNRLQKAFKPKSLVDEIFQPQKKEQSKHEKVYNAKQEVTVRVNPLAPIHEKIPLFKLDRKKIIGSHIKKQQYKSQTIDISTYKLRVFNSKKQLLQTSLKTEKMLAFLPNTQLSANDFQQINGSTDESLSAYKKKLNFLNSFSGSEDYQIRLLKGGNELSEYKNECLQDFKNIKQNLKAIFLQQVDNYIDQYIDKILK